MTQFALMKGSKTSEDARYLDALPVNMTPIPAQTNNASGYLRSFKGIELLFECDGPSMGGLYNDLLQKEYRILGHKLYEDDKVVGDLVNPVMANVCHSPNRQAFVDDGKLKFFSNGQITELKNWTKAEKPGPNEPPFFDLTGVIDVDRHQGRFVWLNKKRFGATSLENEQRPDFVAPFYSPESDPDNNKAIRSCFGKYVAVFGRHTTEFFSLTGDANNLYQTQKNMETQCGIVATPAVCLFGESFAAIGSGKNEALGVVVISPGKYQKISTATIDIILAKYKESELSEALIEYVTRDDQALLLVHLPNETLGYQTKQNSWFQLKSDIRGDAPYTGRHILYNHDKGLTIGDRNQGRVGVLTDKVCSQYDELVEHLLYTPFIQVNAKRGKVPLYDLGFSSITGHVAKAQRLYISITFDGMHYGNERTIEFNEPLDFTSKTLVSDVGAVEGSIGFKLRWVTKDNVSISGLNLRVGYGG